VCQRNDKTLWPRNLNKSKNKVQSTLITVLNEAPCHENVEETEGRALNMIKLTNKYGMNSHLYISAIWYPGKESTLHIWHEILVGPKACQYTEAKQKIPDSAGNQTSSLSPWPSRYTY
jgi:hypothetical protein